jgi:hypothetical protein
MAKISKDIPVESSINLLYGGGSIFSFGIIVFVKMKIL